MSGFDLNYGSFIQTSVHRGKQIVSNDTEGRLGRIESDVLYIKRDIAEIKTDLREFRSEFKEIRNDMKTDFRVLFGAIIAVALGLTGVMAKGFGWL